MKKIAFLVYESDGSGASDDREMTQNLCLYLESLGVVVRQVRASVDTVSQLQKFLKENGSECILLLAYSGHGGPKGWSGTRDRVVVEYSQLTPVLRDVSILLVANDTCYGARMLAGLKKVRRIGSTMFLSPYASKGVTGACVVHGILSAWPCNQRFEDQISRIHIVKGFGIKAGVYRPQIRWGASLDHLFFGVHAPRGLLRCEPVSITPKSFGDIIEVEVLSD